MSPLLLHTPNKRREVLTPDSPFPIRRRGQNFKLDRLPELDFSGVCRKINFDGFDESLHIFAMNSQKVNKHSHFTKEVTNQSAIDL